MAEERVTEKIYCYDHPSAYNNHDALAIAAMNNHKGDDSLWPMMAMNGGFGMNQWMNNPFAYLMFLSLFRNGGFGGYGWGDGFGFNGQGQQNIEMQNQLQAIRSQLQDNQNSNLLMDAIKGNGFSLSQLSQNLGVNFNTLQKCCCEVQAAIAEVGGKVGFSAERVINAVNMGDCNVIQALKDCCCSTQKMILEQGYQNQLAQKDQMFATQKGFCDLTFATQAGFDRTNTALERGFSSTAFQAQQDKCEVLRAGELNTQRIIDTLNTHWKDEQANQIQDLKFQLSQERQNRLLLSRLGDKCGCGCDNGCGGF